MLDRFEREGDAHLGLPEGDAGVAGADVEGEEAHE